MKNILITIDYNPTAEKVAEMGYALSKSLKAKVTLLHVVVDYGYYSSPNYSPIMGFEGYVPAEFMIPQVGEKLILASEDFLHKTRLHLKDDDIEILAVEGDVVDTILNTAKKIKTDMIVMGTHSRSWLDDIVLGSITRKVIEQSEIPMFIIPTKHD